MADTCIGVEPPRAPWLYEPCSEAPRFDADAVTTALPRDDDLATGRANGPSAHAAPLMLLNGDERVAAQTTPFLEPDARGYDALTRFNTHFSLSVTGGLLAGAGGMALCGPPCALALANLGQTGGEALAELLTEGELNPTRLALTFGLGWAGSKLLLSSFAERAVFNGVAGNATQGVEAWVSTGDADQALQEGTRLDTLVLNVAAGEVPGAVQRVASRPPAMPSPATKPPPVADIPPSHGPAPRARTEPRWDWRFADGPARRQAGCFISSGDSDGLPPGPGKPPAADAPVPEVAPSTQDAPGPSSAMESTPPVEVSPWQDPIQNDPALSTVLSEAIDMLDAADDPVTLGVINPYTAMARIAAGTDPALGSGERAMQLAAQFRVIEQALPALDAEVLARRQAGDGFRADALYMEVALLREYSHLARLALDRMARGVLGPAAGAAPTLPPAHHPSLSHNPLANRVYDLFGDGRYPDRSLKDLVHDSGVPVELLDQLSLDDHLIVYGTRLQDRVSKDIELLEMVNEAMDFAGGLERGEAVAAIMMGPDPSVSPPDRARQLRSQISRLQEALPMLKRDAKERAEAGLTATARQIGTMASYVTRYLPLATEALNRMTRSN
jgi:hypothetical protein